MKIGGAVEQRLAGQTLSLAAGLKLQETESGYISPLFITIQRLTMALLCILLLLVCKVTRNQQVVTLEVSTCS